MLKDTEITKVVFRKFKDGQVIALFPYVESSRGFCSSYMHIGQHSDADYNHIVRSTKLATADEYADLKNELENSVGYNLEIIKKLDRNKWRYSHINQIDSKINRVKFALKNM
jgi:hypothetical protein